MPDHLKFLGIFIISLLALAQGVSPKKDVDEAMREGEAAFAKGDFPRHSKITNARCFSIRSFTKQR
jgi:hypothetical protein